MRLVPSALSALGLVSLSVLATGSALAQEAGDNVVVVELFTSQGCVSCPPADALLGELAERADVIALALHVDYWDYIGWEDTFATPENTARQYGYGHASGSSLVYTPQMVIGGTDHVGGYIPMMVAELLQAHRDAPKKVEVSIETHGETITIAAEALMDTLPQDIQVHVVSYIPHEQVAIERGERAGTVSDLYNIVDTWQIVAEWDGAEPFATEVTAGSGLPHVVIFQENGFGPILAAARLN